ETGDFLFVQIDRNRVGVLLAELVVDHRLDEALRADVPGVPARARQRSRDGGRQCDVLGGTQHRPVSVFLVRSYAISLQRPRPHRGRGPAVRLGCCPQSADCGRWAGVGCAWRLALGALRPGGWRPDFPACIIWDGRDNRKIRRPPFGRNMMNSLSRVMLPLCLAAAVLGASTPAPAQDLKIGFLAPRTGIFAQLGTDMVNGFQMYLDEHDGRLGGAKVTFIVEDDQGKPDVDVAKAKKLILQDKVDMLVGAVLASSAYALAPVSTAEKTLYIGTVSTADDLAQRQVDKYPYLVLAGWVPSQPNHPLGQWACDQGYKRIAAIAADYAFGYEQLGGFQKGFEDCGGKIVQKIWVPIGTKDFGPYLPTLKSDVDAIFTLMVGPMSLQFPKQLR